MQSENKADTNAADIFRQCLIFICVIKAVTLIKKKSTTALRNKSTSTYIIKVSPHCKQNRQRRNCTVLGKQELIVVLKILYNLYRVDFCHK